MTSIEAYKKFQLKLNEFDSNNNIDVTPGEFILLFNEQQRNWVNNNFRNVSNSNIDKVQKFKVVSRKLLNGKPEIRYTDFELPADYFDYIESYIIGSSKCCSNVPIRVFDIRDENLEFYYNDRNNEPSLEYEETFKTLADNRIQIYKKNFEVDILFLTYYRFPKDIDILGYDKLDGTSSTNIDPELEDFFVDKIIDICILDSQRINENGIGTQLSKDRISSK